MVEVWYDLEGMWNMLSTSRNGKGMENAFPEWIPLGEYKPIPHKSKVGN